MENRSFVVVGVELTDSVERLLIGFCPDCVVGYLPVFVEYRKGIDVIALALGGCAYRQGSLKCRSALLEFIG